MLCGYSFLPDKIKNFALPLDIMEGMSNTLPEVVRAYMSEIGSKRTEAKSRASRLNAAKGAQARRKDAAQVGLPVPRWRLAGTDGA